MYNVNRLRIVRQSLLVIGWAVALAGIGWLVQPRQARAACVALPTDKGQASFTVTIPSAGSYRVWSRVYVPAASANGFYMQIDQSSCNVVVGHGGTMPAGQFTWVDWIGGNPATLFDVSLTAGSHTVIAAGLDANVGLDEIMFLSDKSCVPTGNGGNCINGGVAVTPVPQPSTTPVAVSGSKTASSVSGVISLTSGGSDVVSTTYSVDGKAIDGSQLDTTKLSDGSHTVNVITKTADGKVTTTTQTIEVQNGWQYKLVAGMRKNWLLTAGLFGLLVIGAVGGYLVWRNRLKWFAKSSAPASASAQMPATPTPATALPQTLIMPDSASGADDDQPNRNQ